ncbi:MAG: BON domain-containing protein [Polaromonas sp.]|uniref:BON domain-containing protein n=1 Tax=Polaromonas sp. TaxID=1869339 RepID=UPI00271767BB|nr:BON domain-containing protein [Polaromonas sp.]MDO9116081.1 BON domain-containing protein [Polaromonas sp.]MDP1888205.1 BON domain-containing protein [Polaromonas sp.]
MKLRGGVLLFMGLTVLPFAAMAQEKMSGPKERGNRFNDPFLQVTSAMPGCPVPEGPMFTQQQVRAEAHVRAQHGGSCFRSGRCRLPNSYLYDREIIPRMVSYLRQDGRFNNTSVWVLGERRLVTLMGCVQTPEQARAMEQAVMLVDDVMGVINHLSVGTTTKPTYSIAPVVPSPAR